MKYAFSGLPNLSLSCLRQSCLRWAIVSRSPNLQTALTEFAPLIIAMTTIDSMEAAGMDLLSSRQSLTPRMAS